MRERIAVNFTLWPRPFAEEFAQRFPAVWEKYDVVVSDRPDVVFYSIYAPGNISVLPNGQYFAHMPVLDPGPYLRVFVTPDNVEPVMAACDFAITFSTQIDHPNHLRLPIWVHDLRRVGIRPEALVKDPATDWERMAAAKTGFCNFVYSHAVAHRDAMFDYFGALKRVDAGGSCRNNMGGWTVPGGHLGKVDFQRAYKFSLAIENAVWPGYTTEKLVEPMLAGSVPVYFGDPLAVRDFDPASYLDFAQFGSLRALRERVRDIDNDRDAYLRMLAAPFYRGNRVPEYAREDTIVAFFDRIFAAARARR